MVKNRIAASRVGSAIAPRREYLRKRRVTQDMPCTHLAVVFLNRRVQILGRQRHKRNLLTLRDNIEHEWRMGEKEREKHEFRTPVDVDTAR